MPDIPSYDTEGPSYVEFTETAISDPKILAHLERTSRALRRRQQVNYWAILTSIALAALIVGYILGRIV